MAIDSPWPLFDLINFCPKVDDTLLGWPFLVGPVTGAVDDSKHCERLCVHGLVGQRIRDEIRQPIDRFLVGSGYPPSSASRHIT